MKETIFLTGGSGLLALNWAIRVRNKYNVVLGLHDRQIQLPGVTAISVNLDSISDFKTILEKFNPLLVIHTAGLTSVEDCEKFPDLARTVNTDIASNVSSVCAELSIPLVHISTDHIFSGEFQLATEDQPVNPINMYAATKADAETRVLENYSEALIVRTNFYGWGPSYRLSFSDQIIYSLRKGIEITLFDDVFYTPILAESLIITVHELLDAGAVGIYNVVSGDRISKYDFGIAIAENFALDKSLIMRGKMVHKHGLVQRPQDMSLSNRKVCSKLGHSLGGINQDLSKLLEQEKSGIINEIIKL
jgi:dTDP-4-dehydrorhamnose reductase